MILFQKEDDCWRSSDAKWWKTEDLRNDFSEMINSCLNLLESYHPNYRISCKFSMWKQKDKEGFDRF